MLTTRVRISLELAEVNVGDGLPRESVSLVALSLALDAMRKFRLPNPHIPVSQMIRIEEDSFRLVHPVLRTPDGKIVV